MARQVKSEGRRMRDVPLATKLALVMAGTIALFMLGFALFAREYIEEAVTLQIKHAARGAAFMAAQPDLEAWSEYFGTQFQGLTPAEVKARAQAMTQKEYAAAFQDPEYIKAFDWNRERFRRMVRGDAHIVAVDLRATGERGSVLASSYEGNLVFAPAVDDVPVSFARGSASELYLQVAGRMQPVVRGSYPVIDRDGQAVAEFSVYISAAAIEEATTQLMSRVMLLAAAFVFVGAWVAWFAGRQVTRPLTLLKEDLRIVAGGDLEHRTEARSRDEIGELARSFDQMTQSLLEARQAERSAAASVHQMAVAGEVATSLFPARLPEIPGFDLAGHHETSGTLGGEYYDVLPLPGGRWGLLVGSASGSGLPAAMVMTMARSFLAAMARSSSDPGAMLRDVNALLSPDLRRGMYVTVLLAVLDPAAGTLTVANAGHSPLLLYRGAAGGKLLPVHSEGIALGFDKGPVFDRTLKVVRLSLQAGDRVVLYTPGVTRVTGAEGEALGEERFAGLVRREAVHPAGLFVRRMAALVKKFRGEQPLTEDVTLLSLGRLEGHGGSQGGGGPESGAA
jgi:serine phosphatase RsbU (regulator of sigma subunit)